jgi:hypothetical protein
MKKPMEIKLKETARNVSTPKEECMKIRGEFHDFSGNDDDTLKSEEARMTGGRYGEVMTFE